MILLFNKDQLLLQASDHHFTLPDKVDLPSEKYFEFDFEITPEQSYQIVDVDDDFPLPDGHVFRTLRDSRDFHHTIAYKAAVQALTYLNWNRAHRYCGVCGTEFGPVNPDKSKKCPACGNLQFPQTSMAVITAIRKGDQILLAHNANFPDGLYSLIAGFVEPGEKLEDAVAREIMEEVGLKVKNIRYFDSQPWPFPGSMMLGFTADYDSGEIKTDDVEIVDAHWFTPDNFPEIPHEYSIARRLIDHYRDSLK